MPTSVSSLLLPEQLLDVDVVGEALHPRYLTERDLTWIDELLDRFAALAGRRRTEVEDQLSDASASGAPLVRWRAMSALLKRLHGFRLGAPVVPRQLREAIFLRAAALRRSGGPFDAALAGVAAEQGTTGEQILGWLYADVPAERRLKEREAPPDTSGA